MSRRAATFALTLLMAGAVGATAQAKPLDDACSSVAPLAGACLGPQKVVEAGAAECRAIGAPEDTCAATPIGHDVRRSALAAYQHSWVHRAARFQYRLGNGVALGDAQWLGTHNSFNSSSNGFTVSHTDNNQQLTLTQQLDGDIRALELDVHLVPGGEKGARRVVRVCHGRGPDQLHAGCTNEPLLSEVLPEINAWLDAHPGQVILLYLEDELGDPEGYRQTVAALDAALVTAGGRSRIYRPDPVRTSAAACVNLPLGASRNRVRAAHRSVILVGNCRSGWARDVFGWDASHVEAGSTSGYQAPPVCDTTYDRSVYASKLVRYYEDSTWLTSVTDPGDTPKRHAEGVLTADRVSRMIACGVNLFGFDQFDPTDGRVAASIWSWAPGQPKVGAGACAVQRPRDGRWTSTRCRGMRPAACRIATGWTVTRPIAVGAARAACRARGGTYAAPRTGEQNAQLHQVAGRPVWLNFRMR